MPWAAWLGLVLYRDKPEAASSEGIGKLSDARRYYESKESSSVCFRQESPISAVIQIIRKASFRANM